MFRFIKRLFTFRYKPERLRRYLENNTWIADPINENIGLYAKSAEFFGINKTIYSWSDLGRAIGLKTAYGMPYAVKEHMFVKISKKLGVPLLPKKQWETSARPDMQGIIKFLKLTRLAEIDDIPQDFIAFAFNDYMSRE